MADVIGLGMTHYPMVATDNANMASLLRGTLKDPDIPADRKDPENWSEQARREWGDDAGAAAAQGHREALRAGFDRIRAELDEFQPDVMVVWGDDQYENFREEVVPSFCVLAYQDTVVDPLALLRKRNHPNAWGLPDEGQSFVMRGRPDFAKRLVTDVINSGFDIAYSYEKRSGINFPHAFANTQLFLDWDNVGKEFPYPIVPIAVNCYGEHVIARQGGIARFADINAGEDLDPPGPSPLRCFELGRAVGRSVRAGGRRVALVASSSWSHAFLNDKDWHLRPDTEADLRLYEAMVAGDYDTWRAATTGEVVAAGQHEMLNWFCLLGAMSELGLELRWSEFVTTEVFNSNKAFAVYR
ncbi:hypothetical protein [Streptosporangium sp. NPDC049046]|uniref:DODA-type extradiol aromatic ring-opening family dioxygenase n=1 Tax=Streptosporangium sp. NPDC049046 TaxID=3155031 RepID=UPI00342A1620